MKEKSLCVGVHFRGNHSPQLVFEFIEKLKPIKQYIRDFQFAYHDPSVCKSGRGPVKVPKSLMILFIRLLAVNGYQSTVILNQATEADYENIIEGLKDYVAAGLTGICTQKNDLARLIKQNYPSLELQSSCLSYKLKYEEFKEELEIGFDVINPINDIIRDVENLKRNASLGLKQKILVAEGCLHKCPFEKKHRKAIAEGESLDNSSLCPSLISQPKDLPLFLKANWVTIQEMINLQDYIDVIKLARGTFSGNSILSIADGLLEFVDRYIRTENGNYVDYDILQYAATSGSIYLQKHLKKGIPSSIIDNNHMFNHLEDEDKLKDITNQILKYNDIDVEVS